MAKLRINTKKKHGKINKEIYGHFSEHLGRCIYDGIYVGENSDIPNVNGIRSDVVQALKEIRVPVLRWPGGCFADEYHWKDGIGPKENRRKMINTNWGGVTEDNSFGTHEFFELCSQLGCEAYVNGNLGSGTVQEMSEWVEYITFDGISPMTEERKKNGRENAWDMKYFGVGNESWGGGGNMRPKYYANEYRRYQTFVRNYNPDKPIYKIACGANAADYNWTEKVLSGCTDTYGAKPENFMNGLSLHYYTIPGTWENKGSATEFDLKEYYATIKKAFDIEEMIEKHARIMYKYDPGNKIGLIVDEWGNWFDVEKGTNPGFLYQQNTMRDAITAAINLNIFNKHCDRVKMANIAQMVNVLQSVILTEGDRMLKTPTYHVFNMFKNHQDAELLDSSIDIEFVGMDLETMTQNLTESVSMSEDGTINITIANTSAEDSFAIELEGALADKYSAGSSMSDILAKVSAELLTGDIHAHNTFDAPDAVNVRGFKEDITIDGEKLVFTMPACSVVHIAIA